VSDPEQLALTDVGEPLAATSRLRARYAHLRACYPQTAEWPDKRCYYVARTLDESEEGYRAHGQRNKSDEVGAARANKDSAVLAHIERVRAAQASGFAYGAQQVLADLWQATDQAMGRLPQRRAVITQDRVVIDPETKETETRVRVHQVAVTETQLQHAKPLLELWAKHYGLIRERLEADVSLGMPDLSDAELAAQLQALGVPAEALPGPVEPGASVTRDGD
jgi:hypothetical protein